MNLARNGRTCNISLAGSIHAQHPHHLKFREIIINHIKIETMQELETVKSNDTTDVYSEVLKMFVGTDNLRPNIKQPFFNEDYVIATDAMVLICFKKELLKNVDFTPAENPPNALSIIPEDNIEPIVFETTALREAIKSLKEKTGKTYNIEESECPDCHGINFVTYKFAMR